MSNYTDKTPTMKNMTRTRKPVDAGTYEGRFAIRPRALREKAGLSAEQVANALKTTTVSVHNWESGKPTIRLEVLPKLAELYGFADVRTLLPRK